MVFKDITSEKIAQYPVVKFNPILIGKNAVVTVIWKI